MQFLRLNEMKHVTRYYQIMSILLKLGLSGYDVKPRFSAFSCEYLLQNPLFFRENIMRKKMNPPSIGFFWWGGVHSKVCWLIAYMYQFKFQEIKFVISRDKLKYNCGKLNSNLYISIFF